MFISYKEPRTPRILSPSVHHQINRTQTPKINKHTPDWEGTKADAEAKMARRAKIVFIILESLVCSRRVGSEQNLLAVEMVPFQKTWRVVEEYPPNK